MTLTVNGLILTIFRFCRIPVLNPFLDTLVFCFDDEVMMTFFDEVGHWPEMRYVERKTPKTPKYLRPMNPILPIYRLVSLKRSSLSLKQICSFQLQV